jgi:hypothetical protein
MAINHYEWPWGGPLPELRRHAEVKHALLRDYLVEYFLTLASSPHQDRIQLTVVDGCCGAGPVSRQGWRSRCGIAHRLEDQGYGDQLRSGATTTSLKTTRCGWSRPSSKS